MIFLCAFLMYQSSNQTLNLAYICFQQLSKLDANSLNNTKKADVNIIFFTRCAKVGSESLLELFQDMEKLNNLNVDPTGPRKQTQHQMNTIEQHELAKFITNLGEGGVYVLHTSWIDFERFHLPKPIYINLVRDPVERVISWFFYERGSYKNAIYFRKFPDKPIRSAAWFKKDFNVCVRSGDPECQYVPFTIKDKVRNFMRQSLFFCGHHEDCLYV